jgi:thioredoxin-like negative regulator of GroEL
MTERAQGIELADRIAVTDRGTLYRVAGDAASIVRLIDPRYCDGRFRQALEQLRGTQHPSMAPVAAEGWLGSSLYLQYRLDTRWQTLGAYLQDSHWRLRLGVLRQVCAVIPEWAGSPIHPIGLNTANIVMLDLAGTWFPWLLPCPALQYSSPSELFELDPAVLAMIAPEMVRGLPPDYRAADVYAAGALFRLALDAPPLSGSPEERVEAQARNAAFADEPEASALEPFFRGLDAVSRLVETVRRYTHTSALARPASIADLSRACDAAFAATDPVALARLKAAAGDSREALRILDWGFASLGDNLAGRLLAADICEKIEDLPGAAVHLDAAVQLAPDDMDLRLRRGELRWLMCIERGPLSPGAPDPDGDRLLADLQMLKMLPGRDATEPYLRAAAVYRMRGDLIAAANELYEAVELEQSDIPALLMYAECLREMGCAEECAGTVAQAHYRLDRMTLSEMMTRAEADQWRQKFASLLQS